MLSQVAIKLLRVGGACETVSMGAIISLGFRNWIIPGIPARVSCIAALGCNETGGLMFCCGKLPAKASVANPSAMQPKTIRRITGKLRSCMVSLRKGSICFFTLRCTGVSDGHLLPRNAKLRKEFFRKNFSLVRSVASPPRANGPFGRQGKPVLLRCPKCSVAANGRAGAVRGHDAEMIDRVRS